MSNKTTNYIKIKGTIRDLTIHLFIKETQCLKVLQALARMQDSLPYPAPPFAVSMRKVRIANKRKHVVEGINATSLKAVGVEL